MKQPNVLFVMCDQMQFQRQGKVDPMAYTPNLDRLADEGIFFTHFHASNGQCVPSRVSMQTGLYPHEAEIMIIYGFHGHTAHITGQQRTIGHVFSEAGYTTAYFGKTHFGCSLEDLGYQVGVHGDQPKMPLSKGDREITDAAIDFVDSYERCEPLFLTVSLHMPHPPFEEIEEFSANYPLENLTLPESYEQDDLSGKPDFLQAHSKDENHGARDERKVREELKRYYTMISGVDQLFGEIRDALEGRGMWEDTVVVFTSDHGDMMGAHRMRLKGTIPYEEIFRIPLIVKYPGLAGCRPVVDDLAVNVSLPGTILDLAGLQVPKSFKGGSLVPAMRRASRPENEMVFYEHYGAYWGIHPFRVARTRTWKYVKYYGADNTEELHNLEGDPNEICNLAGNQDAKRVQDELESAVDQWWLDTEGKDAAFYETEEFKVRGRDQAEEA
jgi:arylsulfatase